MTSEISSYNINVLGSNVPGSGLLYGLPTYSRLANMKGREPEWSHLQLHAVTR